MNPRARAALEASLGSRVVACSRVVGGDIAESFRVRLAEGSTCFVKLRDHAPPGLFLREAEGLDWLREAEALPVPRVVLAIDEPPLLVLEWLEPSAPAPDHEERLGRGLAALHRAGAPTFGAARDGYLATLPLDHRAAPDAATQLGERRLLPLALSAEREGVLPPEVRRRIERVVDRLPELLVEEPPQRVHGDLWSGNVHTGPGGHAYLIDPAAHGGPRELDLAMMRLFGGFGSRVFSAYQEAYPPPPGAEERVALFQTVPLLAHVCLFGEAWVPRLDAALRRYG